MGDAYVIVVHKNTAELHTRTGKSTLLVNAKVFDIVLTNVEKWLIVEKVAESVGNG